MNYNNTCNDNSFCSKTRMEEAISAEQMGRAIFEVGSIHYLYTCTCTLYFGGLRTCLVDSELCYNKGILKQSYPSIIRTLPLHVGRVMGTNKNVCICLSPVVRFQWT